MAVLRKLYKLADWIYNIIEKIHADMFLIQYITISLNLYECFKSVHDLFQSFLKFSGS